ncbi:sodium/mannose cotransporter SLC5A10-like [Hydractinia symbiolongicarpus]|uniref:sodium/mannose cotransporter SLC5A10-like n=1 Tax=Hydractinia symbiolongicarpus TaxID=13093 RepID=UPI002551B524|nr:sodium/mannose cotransporter SLC5A10-like [Hydractinia symbiolongicarpus]
MASDTVNTDPKNLAVWDWIVIGVYFAICLALGIYSKFGKNKNGTAEEYFLAGRSMMWWAVGGSLYASNMGSEHFIGLAGSGAAAGIGVVAYEWHASWILLLLGFFFVPVYIRSKIYTMPEYLRNRFQSKWMRIYLTVVSLISYITTKIAVDIYAGGIFLKKAIGINIYASSAVLLAFTAVYTLLGGLTAVIYTDVMQCTLMVVGALALSIIGFKEVGGINGLWDKYAIAAGNATFLPTVITTAATNVTMTTTAVAKTTAVIATVTMANATTQAPYVASCYKAEEKWDHMFRPLDDKEYPWIGIVFSLPITGIWYWCTDQVIVQRTLGAKSMVHARLGTIVAGFLKLLPLYIMVMPGMISRVLYPDIIACPDPKSCKMQCDNEYGCSNEAYPELVLNILPVGLVGLMLAVMVAALMSSLSSAFNSASTIFTMDIWRVIRPKSSNRELLIVGRVVVCILVVVGMLWLPIVSKGHGGQLFKYLQTIQSYLAPPTCAVFLVGMLWPRLTEAGALTSMLFGLLLGIIRLSLDVAYPQPHCGQEDTRNAFVKLHFMYYALLMFFVCIIIMVTISLFTRQVPLEMLGALTWKTINRPRYREGKRSAEYVVTADVALGEVKIKDGGVENSRTMLAADQEELDEIEQFEHQSNLSKWGVRFAAFCLVFALSFLWIWYR